MTAKQKAARAKFKAIVKEASKLRKKNPKLTQAQAVKQAWAISYGKKRAGVGAVKKKAAKKKTAPKKKATTSVHKDTKSHNVNIRVMSGIGAIKRSAETILKNQYGSLAAKKLVEKTKRGKSKIAKSMREIATKIRKIEKL
jgi:hypothetical protein